MPQLPSNPSIESYLNCSNGAEALAFLPDQGMIHPSKTMKEEL